MRLRIEDMDCVCNITGRRLNFAVTGLYTSIHGNKYSGSWKHPLTAYRNDKGNLISIKVSPSGIDYRNWRDVLFADEDDLPASNIKIAFQSQTRRAVLLNNKVVIWAAGYDTDKGKTRNWYENALNVYPFEPDKYAGISSFIINLLTITEGFANDVSYSLKTAWFNRAKDATGDFSFIERIFWSSTEDNFNLIFAEYIDNINNEDKINSLIDDWTDIIKNTAYDIFDTHAMAQQENGLDLKRIVRARRRLVVNVKKAIKKLNTLKHVEGE